MNHHGIWAGSLLAAGVMSGGFAMTASAQSNLEISGLLGTGVGYTSNVGGGAAITANPGVLRPSAVIFRGAEDLGDGNRAVFNLGTLFSILNGGVFGGPGTLFSRESYVGLANRYGTLTLGNQRDFMFDSLTLNRYPGSFFEGAYAAHQGPFSKFGVSYSPQGSFDFDRVNGEAITNTIKVKSADFYGLTFGAMYGFGGVAGSFGRSSATSFGINYERGNAGFGVAYTMVKAPQTNNGNDGIRNLGFGLRYGFDRLTLSGLATVSHNTATGAQINVFDVSAGYDFVSAWYASLTYSYMHGNAQLDNRRANQLTSLVGYRFSKRTTVYVDAAYQLAYGAGAQAQVNASAGPSSSDRQFIGTLSIQHTF
ncbi:porin [Pandoraea fibrosis]|uniref:Porin n=1 Tax=Pandoraea fibrosis TaxID=1891094 RepID=A0ABX6HK68_9BURK|nr:porin [Pandoraea fibrosis]QHE90408.1 porin [Pandoraea fibrosis]QHF11240.1 porin [Pandoraea fibrosis]